MSTLDKFVTEKNKAIQPSMNENVVEEWLRKNFRKEDTKRTYRDALVLFLKSVYGKNYEHMNVSNYLSQHRNFIDDFKNFLRYVDEKKYTPITINSYASRIKIFFARHGHKIPEDDWKDIRRALLPANITTTQDEILTKEQFQIILNHLSISGRALCLFLLSTGARIGETLQLKKDDLDLDADPPQVNIRPQYTKRGLGGRILCFSYEARDVLRQWLNIKETRKKRGKIGGVFSKDLVFGFTVTNFRRMWYNALKKADLGRQDPGTKYYIYHIHTLRKFFRTRMGLAGVPDMVVHAWMGHKAYLNTYDKLGKNEMAKIYRKHMDVVSIYGGVPSEFKEKLEAIEKDSKAKTEELRKVDEMLDKLGIGNDRSREERLLEYFRVTQGRQVETVKPLLEETSQPSKIESRPLTSERKSSETEMEKWICLRDLPRHPNPEMQTAKCNTCKATNWTEWKACQELKLEAK